MTPLEIARAEAGQHLDAVLRLFKPGAKGTLLVRSPEGESQPGAHDFVITNDDLAEVAAMIDRRRAATKIGSDIPTRAAEVEPPAPCSVIPAGGSATPKVEGLTSGEAEPVAWCSPGQLNNLTDVDKDAGVYLPIRKTRRGNFTMPLYAASPKATASVRHTARKAAFLAIHGHDGDPFQNPETYDFASKIADAVIDALTDSGTTATIGGERA